MKWESTKIAPPKDKLFLAWYESKFGPKFGTMGWVSEKNKEGGRFHSYTMGTQTKCATHWALVEGPVTEVADGPDS